MKRIETKTQLVLYFLEGSKRFFLAGAVFACLVVFFDLINPRIIGYTVDEVIGRNISISGLGIVALAVALLALLGGVCRYCFQLFNSMGAEKLVKRMRDELYRQIASLPFSWYGEHQTGDIIQRCTSDVETIKRFLSEQMTALLRILVMILFAVTFMFRIHVKLTMAAALSIPVVVLYSVFFHNRISSAFAKVDEEEGRLSAIAQENLTGVRVVRAFGRELYEKDRFEKKNEEYTHLWVYLMKLLSGFFASNDLICGAQIMLVLVLGAYYCVNDQLTARQYLSFVVYNSMLTWPVRTLGRVISEMSKAGISAERILYIMNARPEEDPAESETGIYTGDICFEHVSFAYPGTKKKVLDDISFTISGGKTVGILGGTGTGKSTLVHLLDRLYPLPVHQGRITIGGIDIAKLRASELRRHVGLVLQEPYLFSRTLEENIKIAADNAGEKELHEAVEAASLDGTIAHFTEGYQTFVGERGVTLSGGQKQRTAIAQMLIRKPDIMVFDDSLSAVDAQTDAKIRQAIREKTAASTVILISHRITTLMQADEILVLEQGRVAERGTHEELLKKQEIYSRIYELQMQQA